jgi:serine/threonine protein kinase
MPRRHSASVTSPLARNCSYASAFFPAFSPLTEIHATQATNHADDAQAASTAGAAEMQTASMTVPEADILPMAAASSFGVSDGVFAERRRIIPAAQLGVGKTVGEGTFGRVYKGTWRRRTVAVKCLFNAKLFSEEVQLLSMLSHRNIVRYLGESPPPSPRAASDSAATRGGLGLDSGHLGYDAQALAAAKLPRCGGLLVTEFCNGGTLHDRIYASDALRLELALRWMLDVIQGLAYLHWEGPARILHLDLKPLNVLINARGVCKLADLGTAMRAVRIGSNNFIEPVSHNKRPAVMAQEDEPEHLLSSESSSEGNGKPSGCRRKRGGDGCASPATAVKEAEVHRRNVQGTVRYMAPELIRGERVTDRADIWSFGVLCAEILTRDLPFKEMSNNLTVTYRVGSTNCAPTLPPSTPPQLREIIESCFMANFTDRPSASSLRHAVEDIFCSMPGHGDHSIYAPIANGFRLLQTPAETLPPDLYVAPPGSSGASVFQSTESGSDGSHRDSNGFAPLQHSGGSKKWRSGEQDTPAVDTPAVGTDFQRNSVAYASANSGTSTTSRTAVREVAAQTDDNGGGSDMSGSSTSSSSSNSGGGSDEGGGEQGQRDKNRQHGHHHGRHHGHHHGHRHKLKSAAELEAWENDLIRREDALRAMEIRLSGWETSLRSRERAKRGHTVSETNDGVVLWTSNERNPLLREGHRSIDIGGVHLDTNGGPVRASASRGPHQFKGGNMDTNADHPTSDVELADDEGSASGEGSSRGSRSFSSSAGGVGGVFADRTADGDVDMSVLVRSSSSAADDDSPTLPGTGTSTATATADVTPVPTSPTLSPLRSSPLRSTD